MKSTFLLVSMTMAISLFLSACGSSVTNPEGVKVVASTTLIADLVKQIGGDRVAVTALLPVGADPHTFEPRPGDIAALSDADVVFINGLHLEEALEPVLETNVKGALVEVSEGIEPLPFVDEHEGEEQAHEDGEHSHSAGDPHTWTDPNNVIVWAQNIAAALSKADPANAETYQSNAEAYIAELQALDEWIRQQVERVPVGQRKLVTDHSDFGYFADEYGFEQVGLVVPSISTNAAPSAQELAELEDAIHAQGVKAIFVGNTVNPALSEQVARDTGAKLVFLYTDSLGEAGSQVDSYLNFMRYNVSAIVDALK
jgi:zinc/manganese transport system substrate-binding protein/manganese/iron transport system substrate-binding protein